MGVGPAAVRADWVKLLSLWKTPTSPDHGDGGSDIEASGEMDVAAGARISCSGFWRRGNWSYGRGSMHRQVEDVPAVSLNEDVGRLDLSSWYGDGPPEHEDLMCLLCPSQKLVGAAAGDLQNLACCVLKEEDVRALL
jgi:hypothetical protein